MNNDNSNQVDLTFDNQKITIIKLSRHFYNKFWTYGFSESEILSLIYVSYCKAVAAFDPTRGAFFSLLYATALRDLRGEVRTILTRKKYELPLEDLTESNEKKFDALLFSCDQVEYVDKKWKNTDETLRYLNKVTEHFGEKWRTVIELWMNSFSRTEISQITGEDYKTISNFVFRIIEYLRTFKKNTD